MFGYGQTVQFLIYFNGIFSLLPRPIDTLVCFSHVLVKVNNIHHFRNIIRTCKIKILIYHVIQTDSRV